MQTDSHPKLSWSMSKLQKVIVICGPTAAGKSETAVLLSEVLHCPIINADSRQFYSELNIGVARPTLDQLQRAKHYLVADRSIHQPLHAAQFAAEAHSICEKLASEFEHLILCGGSGLYLHAFLNGLDVLPDTPESLRKELNDRLEKDGLLTLTNELKERDPEAFHTIDLQNPRRVLRALEIIYVSGKKASSQWNQTTLNLPFQTHLFLVHPGKEILHQNIHQRTKEMFDMGLIDECKQVLAYKNLPVLQTIGYKEVFEYLEGNLDVETCKNWIEIHTRQYAKRQLTWFRNKMKAKEVKPLNVSEIVNSIS